MTVRALAMNPWWFERSLVAPGQAFCYLKVNTLSPLYTVTWIANLMRHCPRDGMVDIGDLKSLGWKAVPVRVRPRVPFFLNFPRNLED